MALSKTELLEMIESTITANGAKEITGASLNAALTAIVEAMGTAGGGGGNIYCVPMGVLMTTTSGPYIFTPEEAAAFTAAIDNFENTTFAIVVNQEMSGATVNMKILFTSVTRIQSPEEIGESGIMMSATARILGTDEQKIDVTIAPQTDGSIVGFTSQSSM